ncbi:hypothetical protein HDU82_004850 [Entophlyctis luteolus]|nr:hypothetical protein HDU82_004850 [Entophlyctis luteolus]
MSSLGAYKPFVTEYKLSFKDPTPFVRKSGTKNKKKAKKQAPAVPIPAATALQLSTEAAATALAAKKAEASGGGVFPLLPSGNSIVSTQQSLEARARRSKSTKTLWAPPPANADAESTSLNLPGMLSVNQQPASEASVPVVKTFRRKRVLNPTVHSTTVHKHRYNIISGSEIFGEPYSGYKEGHRAVIQTFAHIDMTTNVCDLLFRTLWM